MCRKIDSNQSTEDLLSMSLKELLILNEHVNPRQNKLIIPRNERYLTQIDINISRNFRKYIPNKECSMIQGKYRSRFHPNADEIESKVYYNKTHTNNFSQYTGAQLDIRPQSNRLTRKGRRDLASPLSTTGRSLRSNVLRKQHGIRCQKMLLKL
uniref:uncharacterized protein LOC120347541 isoform X2 n=1 Tax=Styela clava TaxID=7725 RepID=UPI00193AC0C5|nr:uncharacterized protein LOC120347541 isoform X2 [Styela clava]